jgi:hypothetical protein
MKGAPCFRAIRAKENLMEPFQNAAVRALMVRDRQEELRRQPVRHTENEPATGTSRVRRAVGMALIHLGETVRGSQSVKTAAESVSRFRYSA